MIRNQHESIHLDNQLQEFSTIRILDLLLLRSEIIFVLVIGRIEHFVDQAYEPNVGIHPEVIIFELFQDVGSEVDTVLTHEALVETSVLFLLLVGAFLSQVQELH